VEGKQLRLRVRPDRLDAELLGDVALERANGNRRVDASAAARVFAGSGADAPAHGSKGVGGTRDQVGLFGPAVCDQLDISASVRVDRTPGLTLDLAFPVREIRQCRAKPHPRPTPQEPFHGIAE